MRLSFRKSRKVLELAVAFWIGVGLMSIVNVWKLTQGRNPISYSWVMFGISIIFVAVCFIILAARKK